MANKHTQTLEGTMDRIHFKTFYFKTEPSGFQAELLEIFYKSQREATLLMTDDILSFVTICSITPCVPRTALHLPHTPQCVSQSLLSRKRSEFSLSFLLERPPRSQRVGSLSLSSLSETSELDANIVQNMFRICLGRHGGKDCKLALCSRPAAAGSPSPEPRLSLAPPHQCLPFVGLYLLSLARQPSPHPVSPYLIHSSLAFEIL